MDPALEGFGDVLLGSLLAVVGLAAAALSPVRRKGVDPLLASFGLFALLYGSRLICSNPLTPALGISRPVAAWAISTITYTILIPAWFFFWKLLGDGWHSLVLRWLRVVTLFAVVGITSDLIQRRPGTLAGYPNNILVVVGLVVAVLAFQDYRGRMTADLKILMAGLSVFALFAVNDNLVSLGLLPWSWRQEAIGFSLFVGSLGWIAARRFVSTERELASVEGELEAARKIQTSILPERAPSLGGLEIAYRFEPSSTVAGDFFEFLELGPQKLGIVVADVSGHGVPAALIASMMKVAVESRLDRAHQPARLLTEVNRTLSGSFQHGFVTAAYLLLDLETAEAVIATAGHPFPLLHRRLTGTVQEVGGTGPLLGRFPDAEYRQETLALEPGDRLVLYTDGIIEARNGRQEMFGEERLHELLLESEALSTDGFCESLMRAIDQWQGVRPRADRDDDRTLVVVDYRHEPTPAQRARVAVIRNS